MINRVLAINDTIYSVYSELEEKLYKQFHEDYKFFDSLFVIDFNFIEEEMYSIDINISEFKGQEKGTFDLIREGKEFYFTFNYGPMNKDYQESVLKVLNKSK